MKKTLRAGKPKKTQDPSESEEKVLDLGNPFNWTSSINMSKVNLMEDEEAEKKYSPFMVNRAMSYFPDTIGLASYMNRSPQLPSRLQYEAYLTGVRKAQRFAKWGKASKDDDILLISEVYGVNRKRAIEYASLLNEEQLKIMRERNGGETTKGTSRSKAS